MGRPVALFASVLVWLPLAACAPMSLNLAPEQPDAPWSPATTPDGGLVAGAPRAPGQPPADNYVLPSNHNLAQVPPPATDLERRQPYTLAELINVAQINNPTTRNAWNDARNAALAAGIAESTFLPLVSAGIVQGWQRSHSEMPVLGGIGTNDIKANGNIEVLSAQWLLFDFGERAARVDAAHATFCYFQYCVH